MKSFKIQETITKRDSRSLKTYFQELKTIPILTHEEEYEIAYSANQGDEVAREKLVKHNLRFVVSVAKQYETDVLVLEDLINEGNMGLVIASTRFDPSRGFKFLSYAVWWIKRYILAYMADNGKTIRLPNNKINMLVKIRDEFNLLEQRLERQPSYDEMMETLGGAYSVDELAFYYNTINNRIASLDEQVGGNSEGATTALCNLLTDDTTINATHYVDKSDREYRQNAMLGLLDKPLEKKVVNLLYGLDGKAPVSLKDIGFLLGLTSERVRQLRDDALDKFRVTLVK
jgi:RNA polymerase primary sigma factor